MNMIDKIGRRVADNGEATISADEFYEMQAEWTARVRIAVSEVCPVQALQFKNDKPVTHQ